MDSSSQSAISLDELIALNDEISSLVRAGVPLEHGLRSLGADLPGRLGRLAGDLSKRLGQGQGLADALDEDRDGFPRVYRAVVAAGVRSGRLAAALEGLSATARRAAELRRLMIISLVYPIIVLIVASVVFVFTATKTAPVLAEVSEMLGVEPPWWYQLMQRVNDLGPHVLVYVWIAFISIVVSWLYYSSRAKGLNLRGMRGMPTVSKMLHTGRMASFSDVLAMMVEHDVPLDEAVVLSAEATGDRILKQAGTVLAERIRSGSERIELPAGFPPLLAWLIASGTSQRQLVKSLRQSANSYRRRAKYYGNWLTVVLPITLSAGVGGAIAFFYVLMVMAPFYHLLTQLSLP